jgi:hypothetical protein
MIWARLKSETRSTPARLTRLQRAVRIGLGALLLVLSVAASALAQQPAKARPPHGAARGASAVAPARNGSPTPAQILIVLATTMPGAIDPRLSDLRALRSPPFDTYRSMALLSSPRMRLRVGAPEELPLPNGRRMRIVLREITREGRFRLQVSINRPNEQDYLPEATFVTSPGDPVFVAGQSFRAGTLIIGIRLGARER